MNKFQPYINLNWLSKLLPIIPPDGVISPESKLKQSDAGKQPGFYNAATGQWQGLSGWSQRITTETDITAWLVWPGDAVGIITGEIACVDIDVDDPTIAGQVNDLVQAFTGGTATRTRSNSARVMPFLQLAAGEIPRGKCRIILTGGLGAVELLGAGQQAVLSGTHPSGAMQTFSGDPVTVTRTQLDALWTAITNLLAPITLKTTEAGGNIPLADRRGGIVAHEATDPETIERARQIIASTPGAGDGERDDSCYRIVAGIRQYQGITAETCLELMTEWGARCDPPFLASEIKTRINSAYGGGAQGAQGEGHPTYQLQQAEFGTVPLPEYVSLTPITKTIIKDAPTITGGFEQFSLRGQSSEMKKQMLEDKFVLGKLALLGQMLIIFAPPNAGKTLIVIHLIIKAIREDVINGDDLIYINADDGYRGLIQKIELAEKYGFHMVAPDHNGFKSIMLKQMLIQYSESGEAKNKIVILDTIKKFADHMNKKESTDFATVIRSFVSKGGTVIALSHVNKRRGADDKLIHAGTSDFKDDFDTVYMLDVIEKDMTFKTVSFTNEKSRGDNAKQVSFQYLNREGDDYLTILNSVNELNDDDLKRAKERSRLNEKYDDDKPLITSLVNNMNANITGKKVLIDKTHEQTGESKRAIEKVLKRYEGDDINLGHQWKLSIDRLNNNIHTYTAHNHIRIT